MSYQIVRAGSPSDLADRVNKLIADGWRPIGGIAVEVYHYVDRDNDLQSAEYYLQAMVKET